MSGENARRRGTRGTRSTAFALPARLENPLVWKKAPIAHVAPPLQAGVPDGTADCVAWRKVELA